MRARMLCTLAVLAIFVSSATAAEEKGRRERRQGSDFSWNGELAAGKTIEIHGITGDIVAEWSSGREVEVTAKKYGRRSDPEEVRIEVVPHENGVTICALYPSPKGRPPNRCQAHESHSETRDNDVTVDFEVRVPSGVRFAGHTVNGAVEARSLRGDVDAFTVNGSVHVSTTGEAQANTVNGSIDVSLGEAEPSTPLEFRTVNGSVRLLLPRRLGVDLRAETVNGEISTDFPIQMAPGRYNLHKMIGTIGGGGRELRVSTVNGSIRLLALD